MTNLVDINGKPLVTHEYNIEITLKTTVRVRATSIAIAEAMADCIDLYQLTAEDSKLTIDSLEVTQ